MKPLRPLRDAATGLWLAMAAALTAADTLPAYLDATGVPHSSLSASVPTALTLANHDPSRDAEPGLLIAKGASGVEEADATKFQTWRASAGGTALVGPVELLLWTAMKDFATDKGGSMTAYLRHCNTDFSSCTPIASATVARSPWESVATWVPTIFHFGTLSTTVASDRRLELKVIVDSSSDDDMWLAYGATAYPSELDVSVAPPSVHHYELSLAATSLACLPTSVTVTACADASSPCTSPSTAVNGATATLSASAGTLGSGTLTFDSGGSASTTLAHPSASAGQVVSLALSGESVAATAARRCCPDGASCSAANSCPTTFQTAGFVVAATAGGVAATLPAVTAGSTSGPWVLRAVRSSTSTAACEAAISGSTTVEWAYECEDPAACAATDLLSVDGGSATAIARNDGGAVSSYTAVPMTFDAGGNAPFGFVHQDVGRVALHARKTVGGALLGGSSNAFVSRPAGFTIGAVAQAAAPAAANPGAVSAAGPRFVAAGEAFGATLTAVTSSGTAAPSFGREATPEGVLIEPTLVLPAGGSAGTLANASVAGGSFAAGIASVDNLAYSEVGIVTLRPRLADGSYLGSGDVLGTASANVGRFVPARLEQVSASLLHRAALACSGAPAFSYLGENLRLTATLRALNASGAVTTNYTGDFARFDATSAAAWNPAGIAGATVFSGSSGRLSLGSASGTWAAGVLADARLVLLPVRDNTPAGPYSLRLGLAPVDADGVGLAAHDLDTDSPADGADRTLAATADLRFGRLRLFSAAGAADRPLALPLQAEHWDGSRFVVNVDDHCSAVPSAAVSRGNARGSLAAGDGAPLAGATLAAGRGQLRLAAPGGGRSGSLDLALSLGSGATDASCLAPWSPTAPATVGAGLAALRSNACSSAWNHDVAARATFGRPRSGATSIYRREQF